MKYTSTKMNAEQMTRSVTGFDEIAIRSKFSGSLETLEGTMTPRALLFVQLRRDGLNDRDAYRTCMEIPYGELEDMFERPDPDAEGNGTGPTN